MLITNLNGAERRGRKSIITQNSTQRVELELMRVQNKSVVFWPWVLAALRSKEVVWGQLCFGFRHFAGPLMTLCFVLFWCTVRKNAAQEKKRRRKNSAGPCPITLIHLSCVASIFHIPLPFMCKSTAVDKHLVSTMIYWALITTSEKWKASEYSRSLVESFVKGAGRCTKDVIPSCLCKTSTLSERYLQYNEGNQSLCFTRKQWNSEAV